MHRSTAVLLLGLFIFALSFGAPSIHAADDLAWEWQTGDRYRVQIERTVEQTTDVLLKPVKVSGKTTLEMQWHVVGVEDNGSARVEQQITRVAVSMLSSRGEKIDWDSASMGRPAGLAAELKAAINPLLENPIATTLSRRGEVLEVSFTDATITALEGVPDSLGIQSLLNPDALKEMLRGMSATLPAEPVDPGANWTIRRDTGNSELPVQILHQLTYDGLRPREDRQLAHVTIATELKRDAEAPRRSDGSPVPSLTQQSGTGELWFDLDAGHPVMSEHRQELVTESPLREMTIKVTAVATLRTQFEKQPQAPTP